MLTFKVREKQLKTILTSLFRFNLLEMKQQAIYLIGAPWLVKFVIAERSQCFFGNFQDSSSLVKLED